jgi:hypothetical protein
VRNNNSSKNTQTQNQTNPKGFHTIHTEYTIIDSDEEYDSKNVHNPQVSKKNQTQHQSVLSTGIEFEQFNSNQRQTWVPSHQLSYHRSNHPLDLNIIDDDLSLLQELCQIHAEDPILRSTKNKEIKITSQQFRALLTHDSPINDAIITLYMEGFCATHNMSYLTTYFLPHLEQYGWNEVNRYFYKAKKRNICSSGNKKNARDPTILIPTFINQNHWVAVVRREIQNKVIFLYADDMNNKSVEDKIKRLFTKCTNTEFFPSNAEWISCINTYYHPHSNECGLALYLHDRSWLCIPILLHTYCYPLCMTT